MSDRPNILVIMSDQHNKKIMGCGGDTIVKTPHLDSLAANGVIFDNCYCPSPLCVPSRMSFMTSRHPHENEVWTNACHLSSDIPTFAHSLGASGYETVLCGRMHFCGPDQRHGFHKRIAGDVTGTYIGSPLPALTPYLLQGAGASRKAVEIAGPGRTGYQLYDETIAEIASQYLNDYDTSDPFCMVVGFVLPHCPFVCPDEDFEYYHDKVILPEYPDGYFENLNPAVKEWRRYFGIEDLTEAEIRNARAAYYGLVAHMDRQIGKIIGALNDSGMADDTIVIYTSDHGEMAGEHGMWWKMNHYDGSASVPLIVSWPEHFPSNCRRDEVVNLIDLGPTLIDIAQSQELNDISGSSILPLIHGDCDTWDNISYTEYCPTLGFPPNRMIRKNQWKLVFYEGYAPQLFNIDKDPGEVNDLALSSDYKCIVDELMSCIMDGWSPQMAIGKVEKRFRSHPVFVNWFNELQPEMPDLWSPPPGTNRFAGDPDSA
ncbi:MAG: sulfatase-like hydrolase/transferase [Armatimonadota bacterium]